jgi:hypothetical protein
MLMGGMVIFVFENSVIQLYKKIIHLARGVSGWEEKNLKMLTHLAHQPSVPHNYCRV